MSFREVTMQDVREVLRRREAGQSARRIARETGLDRKTVGRYLAQANDQGLERDTTVTDEIDGSPATLTDEALETAGHDAQKAGLTVEIGGDALQAGAEPGAAGEVVGLAIAAVVLVATFYAGYTVGRSSAPAAPAGPAASP